MQLIEYRIFVITLTVCMKIPGGFWNTQTTLSGTNIHATVKVTEIKFSPVLTFDVNITSSIWPVSAWVYAWCCYHMIFWLNSCMNEKPSVLTQMFDAVAVADFNPRLYVLINKNVSNTARTASACKALFIRTRLGSRSNTNALVCYYAFRHTHVSN